MSKEERARLKTKEQRKNPGDALTNEWVQACSNYSVGKTCSN